MLATGAARRLSPILVGLLCLAALAPLPTPTRAATDLAPGEVATISNTDGGPVLLRAEPGWGAAVLPSLPAGTQVDILDWPSWANDGSPWYAVLAWGQEGFLPAGFLVRA